MYVKEIISINIVEDILKRPDALDTYLGGEVQIFLLDKIAIIEKPTLIKVNISNANPIDYLFTKVAFCEFYKIINQSEIYDAVFYLKKSQVRNLFWGLLAGLDGNIHRIGDYETDFILENNIKLCITGNEIIFKGTLGTQEEEILKFINKNKVIENDEVYDKFKHTITTEKIADIIRTLSKKKFIYWDEESMPNKIYSINSKIE